MAKGDGVVQGTSGDDRIDNHYVDADGNMVDHGDHTVNGSWTNDDTVMAGDGNDTVYADNGNDLVHGGNGNDEIHGGSGDDTLYGDAGNDTLTGDSGHNLLDGGAGDDTFMGGAGADTFSGGSGQDNIDYSNSAEGVNVNLSTGEMSGGDAENDSIDYGIDGVVGSSHDDHLVGFDQQGTSANDTYTNELYGGAGNDTLEGLGGNDLLDGGSGNDLVDGGSGNDTMYGGSGNDTLTSSSGDNLMDGGDGNDHFIGGSGSDTMLGGSGNDDFTHVGAGDYVDGGEAEGCADDNNAESDQDTLDLRGLGPVEVNYDPKNHESGTVNFLDDHGKVTGSMNFTNIETVVTDDNCDNGDGGKGGHTTGTGGHDDHHHDDHHDGGHGGHDGGHGGHDGGGDDCGDGGHHHPPPPPPPVCFTPGTLIATPQGERLVEDLRVGDKIITRDNGIQEIRWLSQRVMDGKTLLANPNMRPILIRKGALGNGLPERDMMVSPNHRMLVANERTSLYFDEHEVLVSAKHLVNENGVHNILPISTTYVHFMFDQHQVVLSNGAWTESFQPGDYTMRGLGNAQRAEIYDLFPELQTTVGLETYVAARKTLKRHEAALLAR